MKQKGWTVDHVYIVCFWEIYICLCNVWSERIEKQQCKTQTLEFQHLLRKSNNSDINKYDMPNNFDIV